MPMNFRVKFPDGVYEIPEQNLDRAISLGGEVLDDNLIKNSVDTGVMNGANSEANLVATNNNNNNNMAAPIDGIPVPTPSMEQPAEVRNETQGAPSQRMYKVQFPDGLYEIPEGNLEKAKSLGGTVIGEQPSQEPQASPQQQDEYTGENYVSSFAKNVGASFVGGIPDVGIAIRNATKDADNQWEYVTDKISKSIDDATGGYTKDTGPYSKHIARFLGGLFGAGWLGKGVKAAGEAANLGVASKAVEKVGSGIQHLGITKPSAASIGAATAGGAAMGYAEQDKMPIYLEFPLLLGAMVVGSSAGGATSNLFKNSNLLKPIFDKVPGLEKYVKSQNYEELAKQINPDSISNMMKTSIINQEADFLTQKTLSELPEALRVKIAENPALLSESEIKTVIDKGLSDFTNQIKEAEKKYGINLTTGEFTGSPKVLAKEDALANKPNIESFDINRTDRNLKSAQSLEGIKQSVSKESMSAEALGESVYKDVKNVYDDVINARSENWNKNFGGVVDENIIPIPTYVEKLKEFAKLRPDNLGNEVAIKAAKKKLNDGLQYEKNISPKRINDILVGMNQDISRFPNETFSRKQMLELKGALEADLINAESNILTKEQASMVRKARAGYAEDSKILDKLDESSLFSKVNSGTISIPEKITQAIKAMPGSQLRLTLDALKKSPNGANTIANIQRYYIEEAVNAATKGGAENFNPRIFLEKLPKKEEFDIIFDGTKAYNEIKDISVLFKRMAKYQPIRGNSKTAQRAQVDRGDLEEGVSAAIGAAQGKWGKTFSFLGDKLNKGGAKDKRMAEILLSPTDREEVLKYVKSPK